MWRVPRAEDEGPARPDWYAESARFAPASLDWRAVLIDTPDAVCYLGDVRVYPSTFCFQVRALLKPSAGKRAREAFAAAAGPPGPEPAGAEEFDRALLLGVEYEDGRRSAVCLDIHGPSPFEEPGRPPLLRFLGGDRTSGEANSELALEGLPETGPVRFHASWTALGASESTVEFDGAVLRAAAGRSVELWPASGFSSPAS